MSLPAAVQKQQDEAQALFDKQETVKVEPIVIDIDPEILGREKIEPPNVDIIEKTEPAKIIKKAPEPDVNKEELESLRRLTKSYENENKSLKIEVNRFKKEVSDLKAELAKKIEVPAPVPEATKFSAEERQLLVDEGYGDEVINLLEKKQAQPVAKVDNSLVESLQKELQDVKTVTAQTSYDGFLQRLDVDAPTWKDLNNDEGFGKYLQTKPPYSQYTLAEIIKDAENRLDVELVAKIFNEYKANDGTEQPKKQKLEDLATPKSTNAAPPDLSGKPVKWSTEKKTAFYQDVARNPTKYTDEEVKKIEIAYIYPS